MKSAIFMVGEFIAAKPWPLSNFLIELSMQNLKTSSLWMKLMLY
nr:MAG TPA: hypothetical protein [Caudoviricetes sp.]